MHPIVIPLIIGAAGMFFGKASKPSRGGMRQAPGGYAIPGFLTNSDKAYLHSRAVAFAALVAPATDWPNPAELAKSAKGRELLARLAAHALADEGSQRWELARSYVYAHVQGWIKPPTPYPGS